MEWRFLDSGVNNAYYNMSVDEAVMESHRAGLVPPTIRFYQWSPPGLTLGYFQRIEEVVDENACEENDIDIVRRLTGGRAILHDDELTYSLIIDEKYDYLPKSILESYKIISGGIVSAIQSLGLEVKLKAVEKNKKTPKGFSSACFDAPSWYEVVFGDKKLVGSAQTRKKGIILQHGSIPFSIDVDTLYQVLKTSSDRVKVKMKKLFLNQATALDWETSFNLGYEELKSALIKAWQNRFDIELKPGKLISREKELIDKLIKDKYRSRSWNYKR